MIVKYSETLGGLFLKMFDLRYIQLSPPTENSYNAEEIDEVEAAVNEAAIAMIYKLNDATFRPLFMRISNWSNSATSKKDGESRLHRQTTWFGFLVQFFQTLKVSQYLNIVYVSANRVITVNRDELCRSNHRRFSRDTQYDLNNGRNFYGAVPTSRPGPF